MPQEEIMTIIDPDQDPRRPSHHEIAVRAYEIWERRGRPEFVEQVTLADWFDAERELCHHEHPHETWVRIPLQGTK